MGPTSTAPGAIEMAGVAAAPDLSGARSPWVRGPVWDSFWMLSALWLAPIVLWLAYGLCRSGVEPARSALLRPHRLVLARPPVLQHLPGLLHGSVPPAPADSADPLRGASGSDHDRMFRVLSPADLALPWTRAERLVGLVIIDYAWVTWHFASQHFGALPFIVHAPGARLRADETLRSVLRPGRRGRARSVADILAGAVALSGQVDRSLVFSRLDGVGAGPHPRWRHPGARPRDSRSAVRRAAHSTMVVAAGLYILGIAVMVGIALRPRSLFLFVVVWTSQHWIVATGLASQTLRASRAPTRGLFAAPSMV